MVLVSSGVVWRRLVFRVLFHILDSNLHLDELLESTIVASIPICQPVDGLSLDDECQGQRSKWKVEVVLFYGSVIFVDSKDESPERKLVSNLNLREP